MSFCSADGMLMRRTVNAGRVRRAAWAVAAAALALPAAMPLAAQYVGKVEDDKAKPVLRAVAVLEWTGDAEKPKASRLVPISILDGGQLQDAGVYLARPEPMALFPEVEYELEKNGKPVGLFDVDSSGQQLGSWVGLGVWKPLPSAKPKPSAAELAKARIGDDLDEPGNGEPVLHRKHHADDAPSSAGGAPSGSGTDASSQPSDPDRPVLHKKADSQDSGGNAPSGGSSGTNSGTNSGAGNSSASSEDDDPDRPTLHRHSSGNDTASTSAADPDRPVLHKPKEKKAADTSDVESIPGDVDPDRPHLKRGIANADAIRVAPTLIGLPPDLNQMVAVSDADKHPVHTWDYAWTNPGDETKMKMALEDIARDALGLNPPPVKPKTATRRTTTRKAAASPVPQPPAPLAGEQFRVFELAYGSGATMVLSAHTAGLPNQQKFVTLIAQPDLYGNVLVLKKNVTDAAHLDETPRMRLIDAVDAMADNRGELLFELRGATQRQFALYRVLRGQAEQLFVTGGGQFGGDGSQ